MVLDLSQITGIGEYTHKKEQNRNIYYIGDRAFLVINNNTIEVRCESKLSQLLQEKYESVMQSRYFGKGGIEIVLTDQLKTDEINDLVRLSYNLTI